MKDGRYRVTDAVRRLVDFAFPLLFHGVSRSLEDLCYPERRAFVSR